MRRIFFILLSLFTLLPLSAQQTQDALYIYRNDGKFNGFFYDDIEKIEFSRIDTLGVEHQDYVVQEVYALDSIFRIPINAIDSVSFIAPETVYKEDVINTMSDLWNYVIGSDSVSRILLSPTIPAALIPMVGDKLACTKSREWLPGGFYGKVQSVSNGANGTTVVCEPVDLTELFDQYVAKGGLEGESEDQSEFSSRRASKMNPDWEYFTIPVSVTHIDMGDIMYSQGDFEGNGYFDCGFMGKISVRAFLQTNAIAGYVYYDLNIRCENRLWLNAKATVSGSADLKTDPFWRKLEWIPDTPFCILMEAGGKLGISGKFTAEIYRFISTSVTATAQYNHDWKNDVYQTIGNTGYKWLANDSKYNLSGNFVLTAGPYFDVKFTTPGYLISNKAGAVTLTIEGGGKLDVTGEIVSDQTYQNASTIGSESTILYDMLNRDGALKLGPYLAGSFDASIGNWKFKKDLFDVNFTLDFEGGLVPKFSDVGVNYNSTLKADVAHAGISRNILLMSPVGFAVYDSNNKRVGGNRWFDKHYYMENFMRYSMKLTGLEKGKEYTLVPLVKLFNKYDIIGRPWGTFTAQAEPEQSQTYSITLRNPNLFFAKDGDIQLASFSTTAPALTDVKAVPKTTGENQWLTCEVGDFSEADNVFVTVTALPNTLDTPREDDVHITATASDGTILEADIHCSQEGGGPVVVPPTLEVSKTMVTLPAVDASADVYVTTNGTLSFSKTGGSWLSYEYHEDYGVLTITATDNTSNTVRKGSILITASTPDGSISESISVEQEAAEQKYNGLWITMDLHEIESTSGNSLQHVMSFPTLHEHKLPAYCTASVFGNGDAHLRAVDSESSTFSQSFTFGGNTYQIEDETTVEWNITLNKHTNSSGDYVTGHVSQTETSVQTNTFDNSTTRTVTTIEFDLNDVPFYSDNTPVPGYTGYFMVPACEGYKVSKSIEQGRGITNSRGIEKYISGYSRTYTKDDETITYTIDPDYTSWELTVGLWEPWRGSITPYGKP